MLLTTVFCSLFVLILTSCPNNCNGHGHCVDNNYCECDSLLNKNSKDWYGADCSQRVCPSGLSFQAINDVQNKKANTANDISSSISRNLKSKREKANIKQTDSPNPEIISSNRINGTDIFNITTEIPYSFGNTSLGSEIECYYRENKTLIGRGRIVDYNYEKQNENYIIFDFPVYNDTDPIDFLCHLTFLFTDYSLINPQQPIYEEESMTILPRNYYFYKKDIALYHYYIIWKSMDFVLQKLYINHNNLNTGKISCMFIDNNTEINESPFTFISNISESTRISVYNPKDIKIEFVVNYKIEDISNVMCYLYMNKEGEIINELSHLSDYARVYQTVITQKYTDRNLLFDHQDIYVIPEIYINPKPDKYNEGDTTVNYMNREEPIKDIGELLCYIRGSLYPQPSYLMGKADPRDSIYYYILYDFDISTTTTTMKVSKNKYKKIKGIVPSLQFCYMKRLYSDLSLYYPTQITSCESTYMCPIIWYGIYPIFQLALPMNERSSSSFASESYIGYNFDNTVIYFACIDLITSNNNNNEYKVEIYPYQLPRLNWCEPPDDLIFESILLNPNNGPVGKVCHPLIDSKMRRLKLENTDLYKQHLVPTKMVERYIYYKYFPLFEYLYSNVYKVIGYYYTYLNNIKRDFNGGILECYIKETNDYVGNVQILFQSNDRYKYTYILYPNSTYSKVKPTPNNTRCDLISIHNDLTLYIPPIEITETTTKTLVIKDIGFFLKMIGYLNLEKNNRSYEFGCISEDKKDEMKIYQFNLTTSNEEISLFNESTPCNLTFQLLSFSYKLNKGDKCFILSNFNGTKIKNITESDLNKKYDIISDSNNIYSKNYTLKYKSIYEEIRVNNYYGVGIYKVKSYENDNYNKIQFDIGACGGEIDCFDKIENKYLGRGQIYMKNTKTNEYYIRYNFIVPNLTDNPNRMKCNIIHKFKDLSLFNINLIDSRYSSIDKTIIWSNVGYFLKELHFFDHIEDKYIFLCGGGENINNDNINNNIIYTTYTFTLAKSINNEVIQSFNIHHLGDIKFTTSAGPRNNAMCFLLSYINGKPIGFNFEAGENNEEESYKILTSDLYLRYHIEGNNPYTLSYLVLAEPEEKTHLTKYSDMIYDVVDIDEYNYNIHKPGGEMLCYDDSHHKIKSIILGIITNNNNNNNNNNNEYYIQYPDLEEIPSPRNYHCTKTRQYNDMSLYQLKCNNLYDNNGCTELNYRVMLPVLLSMGFDITGKKKLLCHLPRMQYNISRIFEVDNINNNMKLNSENNTDNEIDNDLESEGEIVKEYEAEISGTIDAIFHLLNGVRLAYGTICHIMTNLKGENIPISQSDLKLNNLLYKKTNSSKWLYYKNKQQGRIQLYDSKPMKISAIEAINVIIRSDVTASSGMIECNDIETNEYLGDGILYGKDSKGNLIIQFNFEFNSRTLDDIIIEINNPFYDLSNIPIDRLTNESCYYNKKLKKYDCILKLDGLYELLHDKGFYNNNNNDTYVFACQNEQDVYHYKFKLIRKTTNTKDVEFDFIESLYDNAPELPINFTCHLLSTIEGKKIELNNSDYGTNVFCIMPNKCQIGICHLNENSNYCVKIATTVEENHLKIKNQKSKKSTTTNSVKEIYNYSEMKKSNSNSNSNPMIQYSQDITNCIKSKLSESILILPLPEEHKDIWNTNIVIGKWLTLTTVENPTYRISVQILSLLGISSENDVGECTGGPRLLFGEGKVIESNPNIRDSLMIKISQNIEVNKFKDSQLIVIFGSKYDNSDSGNENNKYEPHKEIECSGAGSCDRNTGQCKCYDGFDGEACERISCPNNCNGNGRCVSLKELLKNPSELSRYQGYGNIYSIPFNGDNDNDDTKMVVSDRIYGCLCDKRHRGSDCSQLECPSSKDPMNPDEENEEKRDCSGRGLCNYKTGHCECFEGFEGEACELRNTYF